MKFVFEVIINGLVILYLYRPVVKKYFGISQKYRIIRIVVSICLISIPLFISVLPSLIDQFTYFLLYGPVG